ncbi:hypothetical protein BGW39_007366 [Mortierella sp. 14UC]|nr:hypothetical protein BGW39_007366 [Mortierella sp. 14UC]
MVRSPVPSTTTTTKVATSAAEAATLTTVQTSPTSPYSTRQQTTGAFGSHTQSGLPSIATSTTRQQQPCHPRTHPTNVSSGTHHPGFGGFGFSNNTGFDSNGAHGPGEEVETMMSQMMQDPTFAQFMSSMLQNPQILESMIATNPMLQTMLGPDVGRRVLQSPQFRHMVASPEALRQVAQMGGVSIPSTTTPPPSSAPGMRLLPSSLISANAPEKRFQVQLQLLSEMGFWDPTKNMRALQVTGGDVNSAIEILCSGV